MKTRGLWANSEWSGTRGNNLGGRTEQRAGADDCDRAGRRRASVGDKDELGRFGVEENGEQGKEMMTMIHDAKTTAGGCELLLLVCLPARLHQGAHMHDDLSPLCRPSSASKFSTFRPRRNIAIFQFDGAELCRQVRILCSTHAEAASKFASTRSTRREEKRKSISLPLHPALGFHNPICARIGILASTSSPTKSQAHAHQPTTRPSSSQSLLPPSSSTSIHPHGNLPTPAVPVCIFTSLSNPRRPRQTGRPATGYSRVWKPPQIEHAPVPSADNLPPSWIPVNCWSTYPARLLLASRNTRPSRVSFVAFSNLWNAGR
ncbi:hypothetical protein HDK77DRAFT_124032 [Phyllosticta capitalensis]